MDKIDILKLLEEEEKLRSEVFAAEETDENGKVTPNDVINEFFCGGEEKNYFNETENMYGYEDKNISLYDIYGIEKSNTENGDYAGITENRLEKTELRTLTEETERGSGGINMPIDVSVNIDVENNGEKPNIDRIIGAVADRLREELSAAAEGLYL